MTASCRDCDPIPKVRNAGRCVDGVQIMHNGVRIGQDCYCGPWMTELIRRLRGHHEPQEELVFHHLVKHARGGTIIELGAWWSYYSLWFLRAVPRGRAVLVEPDSVHLETGRRNFRLNNRTGDFVHASVGRTPKPPQPFTAESPDAVRMVPEVSVDQLNSDHRIGQVEILLADVQGAELETLHGSVASLQSGKIRFVLISTHHHLISGDPLLHAKCLAFIREQGGHVLAEHTPMESFSGDGLIAASFDPNDRELPSIRVSHNLPRNNFMYHPLERDLADAWKTIREFRK